MTFLNGANSVECYKHFKKFLYTSLSSHVKVTQVVCFCFLAVIKQLLSDLSWGDLDSQITDTPPGMVISEACDILMCRVQWPSGHHHTLWSNRSGFKACSWVFMYCILN